MGCWNGTSPKACVELSEDGTNLLISSEQPLSDQNDLTHLAKNSSQVPNDHRRSWYQYVSLFKMAELA